MALPKVGVEAVIENIRGFENASKKVIGAFDNMDRKAGFVSKSSSALGGVLTTLGKTILSIGAVAATATVGVAALGAALTTAFVAGGIQKAADLEQQIANIGAVLGKTKDEVQPLKDLIGELSLNPKLKVNTTEAASAIELLARNGLDMQQIVDGAAESTVQLANATGADFGVAADIATDALVNFNLGVEDMQKAVDGATGVITNSKFDINDYGLAIGQASGIAGAFGVELEDFNTVLAGTASRFNSGSDAGTSFKTFLQRLVPSSDKATGVMKKLGIITADGSNSFFDASGNLKSMAEVSEILRIATGNLSDEQKNQALTTIFGTDAIRTAIGLADIGSEQFNELSASVNRQGQAAESAATRMDTFQGAMEILSGIIEAVQIQIGDKFLPVLTDLAKQAASFAERVAPKVIDFFGGLAEKFGELAQRLFPQVLSFFERVGPAIGQFVLGAIGLFESFGPSIAGFFQSAIEGISEFLGLISSPISEAGGLFEILQFSGLSGLASRLGITQEITILRDKIVTALSELGETVSNVWNSLFGDLSGGDILDGINSAIFFMVENFDALKGALLGVGAVLAGGVFAAILAGLLSLLTPINLIIAGAALLGAAWSANWFGIRDTLTEVWEGTIRPAIEQISTFLQTNIPVALEYLASLWNTHWPAISMAAQTAWTVIQAIFGSIIQVITTQVVPPLQEAFNNITEALNRLGLDWSDVWNAVWEATKLVFAGIGVLILELIGGFVGLVTGIASAVETATSWLETLQETAQYTLEGITKFVTGMVDTVTALLAGDLMGVLEGQKLAFEGLAQTIAGIAMNIGVTIGAMVDTVLGFITGMVAGATGFFQGLYDTLVGSSVIPDLVNEIIRWFGTLPDAIVEIFTGLVETISGIFGTIFESIGGLISEGTQALFGGGLFGGLGGEEGGGLFGGLFGGGGMEGVGAPAGGPGGAPGEATGGPFALIDAFTRLSTEILPLLTEQFNFLLQNIINQSILIIQQLMQMDLLLVQIASVTIPLLLEVEINAFVVTLDFLNQIILLIQQTDLALNVLTQSMTLFGETATTAGESTQEAFNPIPDIISQINENMVGLIETVNSLTAALQAAAEAASSISIPSAGGFGGGGPSGGAFPFQSGTDGVATVPAGFPNDTFRIGLTSGEQFAVAPAGQSLIGSLLGEMVSSVSGPVAGPVMGGTGQTVINNNEFNFGGNVIQSQMDQASLEATILRVVQQHFG